jgi:4-amino-4-deoxy-L-arabinose transferase-like glycosyltransferase
VQITKKSFSWLIISICILGSVFIVTLVYQNFASISSDGTIYALLAKNLVQHHAFEVFGKPNVYFSPGLPFVIAILFKLFGNIELSSHLAVIIFGITSGPLLYLLVKRFTSNKVAFSAAVLLVLNGEWIWNYTTSITPQILVGFSSILLCIILLKALSSKNYLFFLLIGLLNGWIYLIRPEYFFLIFLILIYIGLVYKNIEFKKLIRILIITSIGFLIISLPYLIFLHKHTGYWSISNRTQAISETTSGVAYEDVGDTLGPNNKLYTDIIDISVQDNNKNLITTIWQDKFLALKKLLKGLFTAERNLSKELGLLGIGLAALGLRDFILKKKFRELTIFGIFLIPIIFVAFAQGGTPEYLIQFIPWFIILIAAGFWSLYEDIFNFKYKKSIMTLLAVITILYLFFPIIQTYLFLSKDLTHKENKLIGLWIKNNIPNIKKELIISRNPEFSLYSESNWEIIPNVPDFNKLYEVMRVNNVHYLVVNDQSESRPQFASLINENASHTPLELIHKETYLNNKIYLYHLPH